MANRRLIESELPPVGYASQEGRGRYTGRGGELHGRAGMASRLEFLGLAEGRTGVAGRLGDLGVVGWATYACR